MSRAVSFAMVMLQVLQQELWQRLSPCRLSIKGQQHVIKHEQAVPIRHQLSSWWLEEKYRF